MGHWRASVGYSFPYKPVENVAQGYYALETAVFIAYQCRVLACTLECVQGIVYGHAFGKEQSRRQFFSYEELFLAKHKYQLLQ